LRSLVEWDQAVGGWFVPDDDGDDGT